VLARRSQVKEYAEWNRRWGAPFGFAGNAELSRANSLTESIARRTGVFGAQSNSTTRRVEFPWAFHAVPLRPGMRAVDVGGGMSGLQFVLDLSGLDVVNVDPFVRFGSEPNSWADPVAAHAALNRFFGTNVSLLRTRLPEAGLPGGFTDVVYCISTLEHLSTAEAERVVAEAKRILRPGGHLVLTVDLFLNLIPFTTRTENEWGGNLDIAALVAGSGLVMVSGIERELCGFMAFSPAGILSELECYEMSQAYPQLAQLIVLEKHDIA
jgi:2-polyprenyl-3-methyl-5-hydroxy-6-metoxy-1,4-benzoquinol methylase